MMINDDGVYREVMRIKSSKMFNDIYYTLLPYTIIDECVNLPSEFFIKRIKLSSKEKEDMTNSFLNKLDINYRKKYEEIRNNDRIIYVDKINKGRTLGTMKDTSGYFKKSNPTITIAKHPNEIMELKTFFHELAHVVDMENAKKLVDPNRFYGYWYCSPFIEVEPQYTEELFCDFLDDYGVEKKLVNYLRRESIYKTGENFLLLNRIKAIHSSLDDTLVLTSIFDMFQKPDIYDAVLRFYANILALYFNNIEDVELLRQARENFNYMKFYDCGPDIFDLVGCTPKTFEKTIKKQRSKY